MGICFNAVRQIKMGSTRTNCGRRELLRETISQFSVLLAEIGVHIESYVQMV